MPPPPPPPPENVPPPAEPPPPPTTPLELTGEQEVVKVTVDRREKRLQDYPGSASVFTQEDLNRTGVNSVRTLSNASPFVQLGVQESNTEIFIRGVGSDNNTELGDPAVATYLDNVYLPRPRGVGVMLFDLERLEVNRGPQGTVRGRNALGGSVSLITNKPKLDTWEGKASLQLGNFSQKMGEAMVNIPILGVAGLRLAAFGEVRDPFYHNAGPIQTLRATEDANNLAYRATLRIVPIKQVRLDITNDYLQELGTGYGGTNFAPALAAGLQPNEVPDPRAVIFRGAQGSLDSRHYGISGNLNVDTGPLLIEAISSYRYLKYLQQTPGNAGVAFPGMPAPDLDNWSSSFWHQESMSTTQELRIYSPDTDRFRWTVGGFYFDEQQHAFLGQINDKTNGYAGGEFNMNHMHDAAFAGYADGTFDILKHFRATAGIRYTHETKDRTGIGNNYVVNDPSGIIYRIGTEGFSFSQFDRTNYTNGPNGTAVFQNGVSSFGARDTIQTADINPQGNFNLENGTYSDDYVDWRGLVDFNVGPDHLVYGGVSTGHKSGGFNDNTTINGVSFAPTYRPESLVSIEAGNRNEFEHGKYRVNVSVFDEEYTDQQVQTVVALTPPGTSGQTPAASAVRQNAAQSRILGLEFEGTAHLPLGFVINLNAQLLDARFIGDTKLRDTRRGYGPVDSGPLVSVSNNFLPRASQLTMNYSLGENFKTPIGYFDWTFSAQTKTKYFMTPFNGEGFDNLGNPNPNFNDAVPTYTRFDAGIGYTRPEANMRVELIGSNLTDVAYMTSLINVPNLNLRFFNPPRQLAVKVTLFL